LISAHLPILQVLVPLLAAPLCLLVYERRAAWGISLLLGFATLLIAALLLARTLAGGVVSYELGGWSTHWGIEYRVDVVNAFVLLVVSAIAFVVLLYARQSVRMELYSGRVPLFYAMYMLCLGGLLGVTITGDIFNLFVFMEISALSSYTLIALSQERRALTSAYQYLIMGTIGATFLLIGIGLMYMMTGTLNMRDLAAALPAVTGTRTIETAFAFIVVGISIKLALVPLHLWLPNAYAYAPSVVSAFIAATSTKVAFYVLLRILFTLFGAGFAIGNMLLGSIFLVLALLAIFAGSTAAIFQENTKRMLAYSSVAQIGFMILGVSLATTTGLGAAILHLFNHALMKAALFLALGCVFYRLGSVALTDMRGLGREMPWTMTAFVIGGLSLVGMPLTVGFVSKWYLVLGALETGWWPLAAAVLLASLLTLVYIWRVVDTAWLQRPAAPRAAAVTEAPPGMLLPLWALILANLYFGVDTDLSAGTAMRAAAWLLGGGG